MTHYFYGGYLSNFYPCSYSLDGETFTSSEQGFMHTKALTFNDQVAARKILQARSPDKAKAIGRTVKGYRESVWAAVRVEVMYRHCYAKFSQNPELCERLLATADMMLVEASPVDTIWGIGMSIREATLLDGPSRWRGENLLGQVLMRVRRALAAGGL